MNILIWLISILPSSVFGFSVLFNKANGPNSHLTSRIFDGDGQNDYRTEMLTYDRPKGYPQMISSGDNISNGDSIAGDPNVEYPSIGDGIGESLRITDDVNEGRDASYPIAEIPGKIKFSEENIGTLSAHAVIRSVPSTTESNCHALRLKKCFYNTMEGGKEAIDKMIDSSDFLNHPDNSENNILITKCEMRKNFLDCMVTERKTECTAEEVNIPEDVDAYRAKITDLLSSAKGSCLVVETEM